MTLTEITQIVMTAKEDCHPGLLSRSQSVLRLELDECDLRLKVIGVQPVLTSMSNAQNENGFASDFKEDSKNMRSLAGQKFPKFTFVKIIFVGEWTSSRVVFQCINGQEKTISPTIGLSRGSFRKPIEVPRNVASRPTCDDDVHLRNLTLHLLPQ